MAANRMLRSSKAEVLCAGSVFFASLFIYNRTLAPTVTLVDSGELIVAARSLGVAHPPGFPFYLMLAHLASLVPIGSVAVRVNFASAVFAALAAATLTLVVAELMAIPSNLAPLKQKLGKKRKRKSEKVFRHVIDGRNDDDSLSIRLMAI